MKRKTHSIQSRHLGRSLELIAYGTKGRPILAFPPQCGAVTDLESFGIIASMSTFIDSGQVQVFSVGSVDGESWANAGMHPADRGKRHEQYDRAVREEVLPFIKKLSGNPELPPFTTGCSMGGYHATNFFFRHPQLFGGVISLSGILDLSLFVGDYGDDLVYFNSPLRFLKNLDDEKILTAIRRGQIVICAGRGAWDELMCAQAEAIKPILLEKKIPAWVDIWGHDVNHDWPWWLIQMPYFLSKLKLA